MKWQETEEFIQKNGLLRHIPKGVSGIYAITINGGIVYIGQSKDIYKRCSQHICNVENAMLSKEKKYLLLLSAKLGGYEVDYRIVEPCSLEKLDDLEKEIIEYCNPCLNILTPHGKQDISNLTILDVINAEKKHFRN